MFQACTAESRFCVFVWWCSGQRILRCVLRAAACFALVARLALLERGFPCSSVVSSISVCVVRTCPLRTALDATLRNGSRLTKTLLLSCNHSLFHYTFFLFVFFLCFFLVLLLCCFFFLFSFDVFLFSCKRGKKKKKTKRKRTKGKKGTKKEKEKKKKGKEKKKKKEQKKRKKQVTKKRKKRHRSSKKFLKKNKKFKKLNLGKQPRTRDNI